MLEVDGQFVIADDGANIKFSDFSDTHSSYLPESVLFESNGFEIEG